MGRPCVFVRLTYCNLRCTWCDTAYAFEEGSPMEIDDIISRVRSYDCRLVEVTGGEPLAQEGAPALLRRLCDDGFEVLLETGGSLDIAVVDQRVRRIVDIKCPGSGMERKNLWSNIDHLRLSDEAKFVIADRADFDWAVRVMNERGLADRCTVLMSPAFGLIAPADLARWILDERLHVRFQLQMHKFIWEPAARGV